MYKLTQCELCGNVQCHEHGKRNINFNSHNICGSYLKEVINTFPNYRFVRHEDFDDKKCYSLLNNKREKTIQFEIKKDKSIYKIKKDNYTEFEDICKKLSNEEIHYIWKVLLHADIINTYNKTTDSSNNKGLIFLFELLDNTIKYDKKEGYNKYKELEDLIIEAKNSYCAFVLAANFYYFGGTEKLEQVVIDSKISKHICYFAAHVPNANYNKLKKVIINEKNPKHILNFISIIEEKNQNVDDLIQILMNNKATHQVYVYTIKHIENLDNISKFEKFFIEMADAHYIYYFANNFKKFDTLNINALENALIKIRDAWYLFRFAESIDKANIKKIQETIIDIDDKKQIYNFIKYITKANKQKLIPLLKGTPYYEEVKSL